MNFKRFWTAATNSGPSSWSNQKVKSPLAGLLVSKVMTTQRLNELLAAAEGASLDIYFNLGLPIYDPPTLRGPICAVLNETFLTDNLDRVDYWSPVDVGAIRCGLLDLQSLSASEATAFTCQPGTTLGRLLSEIHELPPSSRLQLQNHKFFPLESLSSIPALIAQVMRANPANPHAWLFEVKMRGPIRLTGDHLKCCFVPNTLLSDTSAVTRLKKMGSTLRRYNPKFGIEDLGWTNESSY